MRPREGAVRVRIRLTAVNSRLGKTAIVLLAGLLPLATSVIASDSTMASWTLVSAAGIGLALFAAPTGRLPRPVALALLGGLTVFLITALTGATPLLSLIGRYPRYEGLITLAGYALAAVAGSRLIGPESAPANRRLFSSAVSVSAVVTAAICLIQLVAFPTSRVIGLLGNSSILGIWALFALAVLGWQLVQDRRAILVAGFVAAALVLLLAASRAAWLGAAAALLVLPLLSLAIKPRPPWWAGPAGAAALALAALLLPSAQARITGATPFADATAYGRLLLWQDTWSLIGANPPFGVGGSRFIDAIGAHHAQQWAAAVGPFAPPDSPHNVVLQVLGSTGFLGFAAVVAIVATLCWAMWQNRPWSGWQGAAMSAAAAMAVAYLFSFTDPVTTSLLFFLLGSAVAGPSTTEATWRRRGTVVGVTLWLAASVFLAGSALAAEAKLGSAADTADSGEIMSSVQLRPWDPDLTIRAGALVAELASRGGGSALPGIAPVSATCAELQTSSECRLVLGDLQTLAGDPASAQTTLSAALDDDPTNVDILLKLGIAQAEGGETEQAEQSFLSAAQLRPSAPEPWDDLAELYRRQGRTAAASAATAKADALR